MLVDLIQIKTRDDVRLDGIFQESSTMDGEGPFPLDAVCMVHGTGGNFYSSTMFDFLGESLLDQGCNVLRVNTRGHDGISTAVTGKGARRLGAAFEVVDDCRHDIAAWVDWLQQLGCERIGLLGHSLGAVKGIYALAQEPDLPVTCLMAISPPRLSYSWFCQSRQAQTFLETYQKALEHVDTGQPGAIIEVSLPLPFAITAAGYLDKYGPEERYNFLNLVTGVKCPLLITFGSIEVADNMAFQGSVEALQKLPRRGRNMSVKTIPDGDHFYTKVRQELADSIEGWVRREVD